MKYNPHSYISRETAAARMKEAMTKAGFERAAKEDTPRFCREEVWERHVGEVSPDGTGHFIRIFTSIEGGEFRSAGKDAIRVCPVVRERVPSKRDPGTTYIRTRGISRMRRVNRTGKIEDIVSRVMDRARDAYKAAREDARTAKAA